MYQNNYDSYIEGRKGDLVVHITVLVACVTAALPERKKIKIASL